MPSSACADAPAVVVPASAAWMPPEPPAPPTDLPPLDTTAYGTVRDSHGRFLKGNPGGTGNPNARRAEALRKALCEAVTAEDMYRVGKVMLQKALEGDVQAAKFLASYVMGRPTLAADPDRLDLEELKIYTDEAAASAGVTAALNGMAAGMSCFFISSVRPAKMHQFLGTMGEALRTGVVPDSMAHGSDPDAAGQHSDADPRQEAPVDHGSDPDRTCPHRSSDPQATGPSVGNGPNGGRSTVAAPTPAATAPSPDGESGPTMPGPAPRPAVVPPARPPISGRPGAAESLGSPTPPSPIGANGPSARKRRRK